MGSEADLDADIKALSILSEHPELYADFVELGCVASLVSLLSHENTDIAIDAIEVINELTDEYVEAEQSQWDALVDALVGEFCKILHSCSLLSARSRPYRSSIRKSGADGREQSVRQNGSLSYLKCVILISGMDYYVDHW